MKRLFLIACAWLGAVGAGWSQPTFLFEPQSVAASQGALVLFNALAVSPAPVTYQWYHNGQLLAGQSQTALALFGVLPADAGEYQVVASTFSGSSTSGVAVLTVDTNFTKIISGEIVNAGGNSVSCSWADYDNDGDPDLFLAKAGTELNSLYRNNGDGTFTSVLNTPIATQLFITLSGSWADYDNDGWLDLFLANNGRNFGAPGTNVLYRNNGDGSFSVTSNALPADTANANCSAWADYDRDGFLDLLVGNLFNPNLLYRNNGNGTLARVNSGPVATDAGKISYAASWGDYNNDGFPDLVVANATFGTAELLYQNNGDGTFQRVNNTPISMAGGESVACSWADYDNDGDLDLFVANINGQVSFLYRNDGNGAFTAITSTIFTSEGADSRNGVWGDYDNDGHLDLFIARDNGQNDGLFRNNGDGTFSAVEAGSVNNDGGSSYGAAWTDYDNDGFLDLFVANVGGDNFLYRNNGNSHGWLKVRLVGNRSNRFGVGARVRVLAATDGTPHWQMREIAARDGQGSPGSGLAEFGLGTASNIVTLRIEWPSGVVQELHDVAPRQFLTVAEPASLVALPGTVGEGDLGLNPLFFEIRLSAITNIPVTVEFSTEDDSALAGLDYVATNGVVTVPAGSISALFAVNVIGDLIDETNKTFFVRLTNSVGMAIATPRVRGTILDDEPLAIGVADAVVVEGNFGLTPLTFNFTLNKRVDYPVTVEFSTANQSAVAGQDYAATNGILTVPAGETNVTLTVQILAERMLEDNEQFVLNLSNAVPAEVPDPTALGFILDDDPVPVMTINHPVVIEGTGGTNQAVFDVTLSNPSSRSVSVNYLTANGTASSSTDYSLRVGALGFTPGTVLRQVAVPITTDSLLEASETFRLNLSMVSEAILGTNSGVGTILDDDLRISGASWLPAEVQLRFGTLTGQTYRVESADAFTTNTVWTPLPGAGALPGNGMIQQVNDPAGLTLPQRFYRIRQLSP